MSDRFRRSLRRTPDYNATRRGSPRPCSGGLFPLHAGVDAVVLERIRLQRLQGHQLHRADRVDGNGVVEVRLEVLRPANVFTVDEHLWPPSPCR